MSDDDDDKPPRKRGRPPKLTVIDGSKPPRAPSKLPDIKKRIRFDHKIAEYCRYRMQGYNDANAQLASGYDGNKPEIVARHMTLIKAGIKNTLAITADSLILEIEQTRLAAMADGQFNVALAAIALKAKLRGLIDLPAGGEADRIPKPSDEPVNVTEMSMEEWKARFARQSE